MRVSPNRVSKSRPAPVLRAEEHIVYQLADLGLQLHKLGRLDAYKQIIEARNDLLALLDNETLAQRSKPTLRITNDRPVIACVRPKPGSLKATDHAH